MMNMQMTRMALSGIVASLGLLSMPGQDAKAGDISFGIGVNVPVRTVLTQPIERVWVPAVYEDREVCVDVPAVIETREVPIFNRRGRIRGYRTVRTVVRPARRECRIERVLVQDGYYRDVAVRRPVCGTRRSSVVVGATGVGFGVQYNDFDDHRPSRRRLHRAIQRAGYRNFGHHRRVQRAHRGHRF